MDLQTLSDRLEIDDLLTCYTRAIDTGEWDRLDAVFTPDAAIDYTSTGGIAGGYPEVKAWLAQNLPTFPRRQHVLGQKEVVLDGETAAVTAYFVGDRATPQRQHAPVGPHEQPEGGSAQEPTDGDRCGSEHARKFPDRRTVQTRVSRSPGRP